ncbi:MAG: cysteine desulfurase family protein [Bacilli bacterium]|mgnify:FL=1|jgi:cysteine desulfurase|nr:aminotransferase V [Bacillota bacterium]
MIYLDNSATTMVDDRVLETFNKVCKNYPGNSNSLHSLGIKSKELEDYATEKISNLLGVKPSEIIYTSGASESNNTVLKGVASKYKNRGNHIITTYLEHSSVLETCKYLENKGFIIDYVKIKDNGLIDIDDLERLLTDNTILVSVAYVDSELGIRQDIDTISKIVKKHPKCYFHVDATQAIGKIKVDPTSIDFISMSAHKIFGLKGIGLLIKKDNIVIDNLIHGGKSTTIYRSGTPALPLICSLMKALELVIPNIDKNYEYVSSLSRKIKDNLKKYDNIHINSTENSIPYIINFSVIGVKPETFIHTMEEEDIYLSTKSACSTSDISLSVDSIYHNREISMSSIRISLSYKNTTEEIDKFIKVFDKIYNKLVFKK